ncbi:hypothetical protein [Paraliomyxa miuraensis]|uniref:hypothetical protein n=1 Tax=Paraliomyxa miuraensis TaxID=376150 RepID=UPI002257A15B|nr:hypothetical protein [Paraliomyxa miuraensis]MCX4242028.1 hypothetical protein [Paraliomyxa miuraensis]
MPAFDPTPYATVPTRTPAATLTLARGLLAAAPSRPTRFIARRLARLREAARDLQSVWIDANRPTTPVDPRPFDLALDHRWAALRTRLEACLLLGAHDHVGRAKSMLALLFPTGLDFLTLPYAEEWAQSERRLVLIATDDLADELDELAGAAYLSELRQAHAAYGSVLGITDRKELAPEPAGVLEPLRALQAAIAGYSRGVIGLVEEDDPESIAAAQRQLEPLLRARRPRSPSEAPTDEPVDAPLPELPQLAPEPAAPEPAAVA